MMRHLMAALACLGMLACGDPGPSPAPPDAGNTVPVEQRPTEEQERALANALHDKHLKSEDEEIKCRACHSIKGHEKADVQSRCVDCHEDNVSKVHEGVKDKRATQCLTCHDFVAVEVNAWSCANCHVNGVALSSTLKDLPDAPKVKIHSKEACSSCHVPHGVEPLKEGTCIECHEDSAAKHEEEGKKDPQQCMSCHGGHESAKAAQAKCAKCHDGVPKAATFEGHDQCTTCHPVHGGKHLNTCSSCHKKQHTLGADKTKDHAKCVSCHPAHVAKIAPPKRCTKCHEEVIKGHPEDDRLGACAGCHPQHPVQGELTMARGCAGRDCHAVAGESAFHAGSECNDCHPKHDFVLQAPHTDLCNRCHGTPRTGVDKKSTATQVATVTGHDQCEDCHIKGPHAPGVPPKDCATCHEEQQAKMTKGHETCADCHLSHTGAVQKDCKDCHAEQVTQQRHSTEAKDCAQCHRPHGPNGPAKPTKCVKCHEPPLSGLHDHQDHAVCSDCHGFHDQGPARGRNLCLSACHQDQLNHEPTAISCVGCHPFERHEDK